MQGCLFFRAAAAGCGRKMVKRPCYQSIQDGQRIEKQHKLPWNRRTADFGQAYIVQKKGRAYIVAEAEKILAFCCGNMLLPHQIGNYLSAHGEAAQKAQKDRIAAFLGDTENPPERRRIEAVQILEQACADQKIGKNQEGQKRRKHRCIP